MQIEIPLDFSDRPKRRPPSRFAAYVKKEEAPIEEGTLSKSDNQSKSMYYLIIRNCKDTQSINVRVISNPLCVDNPGASTKETCVDEVVIFRLFDGVDKVYLS